MNRDVSHICRKAKIVLPQTTEIVGGPGGTRTPNQAVMSAGRLIKPYHKSLFLLKTTTEQNSNSWLYVSQCVARLVKPLILLFSKENTYRGSRNFGFKRRYHAPEVDRRPQARVRIQLGGKEITG